MGWVRVITTAGLLATVGSGVFSYSHYSTEFFIGAFNIKSFGLTKMKEKLGKQQYVRDILVEVSSEDYNFIFVSLI